MHRPTSGMGSSSTVVNVPFADAFESPLVGVAEASTKLSSPSLCPSVRVVLRERVTLRVSGMLMSKMGPGQEDQAKLFDDD